MENRRRPKNHQIGRSKADVRCRKHPKHQQSPGVCSVCLGERLSQLSTTSRGNNNTTTMASSSCSSSSSSSSLSSLSSHYSSSSETSPLHHRYRLASEAKGSISFLRRSTGTGKNNVLRKSRSSMAFVPRTREGEGRDDGKKKDGFWSKLLRPRRKKIDGGLLHLHSKKTMRERVITTRVH